MRRVNFFFLDLPAQPTYLPGVPGHNSGSPLDRVPTNLTVYLAGSLQNLKSAFKFESSDVEIEIRAVVLCHLGQRYVDTLNTGFI